MLQKSAGTKKCWGGYQDGVVKFPDWRAEGHHVWNP